jgi:hypothetical protein
MAPGDGFFRAQWIKGRIIQATIVAGVLLLALLGIGYLIASATLP